MKPRLRGLRHWIVNGKVEAVSPLLDRDPPPRAGWWLMLLMSWDAIRYAQWDQDNTPSYPHKREDQL